MTDQVLQTLIIVHWVNDSIKMLYIYTYLLFNHQEIAPEELLSVIRCNCKLSSRNPCCTNQCSCKACGNCNGFGCNNSCKEDGINDDDNDSISDDDNDDTVKSFGESDNLFEKLFNI